MATASAVLTEQAIWLLPVSSFAPCSVISNDWARSETPRLGGGYERAAGPRSPAIYKRKFPVSARVVSK